MKVLFLTKYPEAGASSRYRVYQYLPFLQAAGVEFAVEPFMGPRLFGLSYTKGKTWLKLALTAGATLRRLSLLWRCRGYDVIYMQRECLPFGPPFLERWFRRLGKKTIFDYDDALFIVMASKHSPVANLAKSVHRVPRIMRSVDCVVAGNDWLRDRASEHCFDARTFHVAEDLDRFTAKRPAVTGSTVTIGWLGSPSTEKYLELIRPVLRTLCRRYPMLRLKVVGGGAFSDPEIPVEQVPWSYENEVAALHSFDIGVMPLPNAEWSRGKSGGKARTYMAVGLPVVCTAIGFNCELVEHGTTGFLVKTEAEWESALSTLIESPTLRADIGAAARRTVEARYALTRLGPQFVELIRSVFVQRPVLYLSYNGINEPLVRTQVLSYLETLTQARYRFVLLTFERVRLPRADMGERRAELSMHGIEWHALPASKAPGPLAPLMDVVRGLVTAQRAGGGRSLALTHARSFVPALIGRMLRALAGTPLLFDMRGFWVDEKAYKGSIRHGGLVFRIGKRLEAWVLRGSDAIVSLTDAGRAALFGFRDGALYASRATTIPTCVDLKRFSRAPVRTPHPLVVGYLGSLSEDYLPQEVCGFFLAVSVRFPDARLHLVTRTDPDRVRSILTSAGLTPESVRVTAVPAEDVPRELAKFDVGLSFIKPGFPKIASCPTKVGEYLASGVPVISNADIGDLDRLLGETGAGIVLPEMSPESYDSAVLGLERLLGDPQTPARCRSVAERHFSLQDGAERYASIYRSLWKP